MTIHEAIDRLQALIDNSRSLPLTRTVVIDREEALELIDRLRESLPDEVKQARWTVQEQRRLIEEAQAEAARTLSQATERAQVMTGEHELLRRAERQAAQIIHDAGERADELRQSADAYAAEVMLQVEAHLMRTVQTVKRGIELLRRPAAPAGDPRSSARR